MDLYAELDELHDTGDAESDCWCRPCLAEQGDVSIVRHHHRAQQILEGDVDELELLANRHRAQPR